MTALSSRLFFTIVGRLALVLAAGRCGTAQTSRASTYCAFEIRVRAPSGAPVANIPAGIVDGGVQAATVLTNREGVARICDVPLHRVDVAVGIDLCGLVLIKNVTSTWPNTRQIFATYVPETCPHLVFSRHCQALLRVINDEGRPLARARFVGVPSG
jgi:hypothetical protein